MNNLDLDNILFNHFGNKFITDEEQVLKPDRINFYNTEKALEMLHRHIQSKSRIYVHGDVDCDGVGCCYILKKSLVSLGVNTSRYMINLEKVHGIQEKHVEFFKDKQIDLLIILDSSSNEIETIKKFKCDVLVVDHHEVESNELNGYTQGGKFIVVNNMVDNEELGYKADENMSCGLVLYELLRNYCNTYTSFGDSLLENMMLYQWVGLTLYTDAILLNNTRNCWYIDKTISVLDIEPTLRVLMNKINSYKKTLGKTFINYSIAPLINKAIRAGKAGQALDIVLSEPDRILELKEYEAKQAEIIKRALNFVDEKEEFDNGILLNITELEIHKNYCGVIASKLCDTYKKNTVVFKDENSLMRGSFRGRVTGIDYRSYMSKSLDETQANNGEFAQGHKTAFGVNINESKLRKIVQEIGTIEPTTLNKPYLTIGFMPDELKGSVHLDKLDSFKKIGGVLRLGIANSRLSTQEQLDIIVSNSEIEFIEKIGNLYKYSVCGIECKAFEELPNSICKLYIEYSSEIECFIKKI